MSVDELRALVNRALQDLKAENIVELDVAGKTSVTDFVIVASGNSNRHIRSIANNVVAEAKKHGVQPLGVEGEDEAEWLLVDLGDVVVHVMLPRIREFYDLESLWRLDIIKRKDAL